MSSLFKFLLMVVVFLILWVAAVFFSKPQIEKELTGRCLLVLAASSATQETSPTYQIQFAGRDGFLSGSVATEALRAQYEKYLRAVWGVRVLHSSLAVLAPPAPEPPPAPVVEAPSLPTLTQADLDACLVYFDVDQSSLSEVAAGTLGGLAGKLTAGPRVKLTIEGHTDETGSDDYNLKLGQARASAVEKFLLEHGVAADTLQIVSYGKSRPVAQGKDAVSLQQNRRVRFSLTEE